MNINNQYTSANSQFTNTSTKQQKVLNDTLIKVTKKNSIEHIQKLIASGKVNINCQSNKGDTPLHKAAGKGYLIAIQHLLESGASPNILNNDNNTPLHELVLKITKKIKPSNPIQDLSLTTAKVLTDTLLCEVKKDFYKKIGSQGVNGKIAKKMWGKALDKSDTGGCYNWIISTFEKKTLVPMETILAFKELLKAGVDLELQNKDGKTVVDLLKEIQCNLKETEFDELFSMIQRHQEILETKKIKEALKNYNPLSWKNCFETLFNIPENFKPIIHVDQEEVILTFTDSLFFKIIESKLTRWVKDNCLSTDADSLKIIFKSPPQLILEDVQQHLKYRKIKKYINCIPSQSQTNTFSIEELKKNQELREERYYQLLAEQKLELQKLKELELIAKQAKEEKRLKREKNKEQTPSTPAGKPTRKRRNEKKINRKKNVRRTNGTTPLPLQTKNPVKVPTDLPIEPPLHAPFKVSKELDSCIEANRPKIVHKLVSSQDLIRLGNANQCLKGMLNLLNMVDKIDSAFQKDDPIHQIIIQHGLSYYIMRFFECIFPTSTYEMNHNTSLSKLANQFVIKENIAREARNQIRHNQLSFNKVIDFARWLQRVDLLSRLAILEGTAIDKKNPVDEITIKGFKLISENNLEKEEELSPNEKISQEVGDIIQIRTMLHNSPDITLKFQMHAESAIKKAFSNISVCLQNLSAEQYKRYKEFGKFTQEIHKVGNLIAHSIGEQQIYMIEPSNSANQGLILKLEEIEWEYLYFLANQIENILEEIQIIF